MVIYNEQMELFRLIANNLEENIESYAFGGTAMLFYGYKDETKDIDIFFETDKQRRTFIDALESLGFEETSPIRVYIPEKLRGKHRPIMYTKENVRFDLFAKKIIHTVKSEKMKEDKFAVHEFKGKKTLIVNVFKTEHIVMLKAVTERKNDFDDIRTIVEKDKYFEWQYLIDEVLWQYKHGDSWVLLDMEKTLKELKKYVFIPDKYVKQLYRKK